MPLGIPLGVPLGSRVGLCVVSLASFGSSSRFGSGDGVLLSVFTLVAPIIENSSTDHDDNMEDRGKGEAKREGHGVGVGSGQQSNSSEHLLGSWSTQRAVVASR